MPMLLYPCLFLISLVHGSPVVFTSQGGLRGRVLVSRSGRNYNAFTKIPYAQPPLGSLRFMPPLPAKNWTGMLDATELSPLCYQSETTLHKGQEDCLYLNVYTPQLTNASLPILFYIHGGAFIKGNIPPAESSKYFMDEDVVLVTSSYRLGRLGLLSLEDEIIPGNMALKDIALAIRWVKKEIKAFGGNSNLLTLFGNSAGGVFAHYLCSSPRISELVRGCISQSGVGGSPVWTLNKPGYSRTTALDIASALGCSGDRLLSCLQSKTVDEIMDSGLIKQKHLLAPVIEPPSEHAIITTWPPNKTNFSWITGITEDEGMLFTGHFEFNAPNFHEDNFKHYFKMNIIDRLDLENRTSDVKRIWDRFVTEESDLMLGARKFGTEAFFSYPTFKALSQHSGPKYFYVFNYTGGPSYYEVLLNKDLNITGVCHADDYPYFFYTPHKFTPEGWPGVKDILLSQILIKIWVAFAREQTPLNIVPRWRQFKDTNYLHIGHDGLILKKYENYDDVINFWKDII